MVRENLIPRTEMVYELKNEIPSFEEFMKTYESDDKIINSYEDELEAKSVQGPQYGPGKINFGELYRNIKRKLGLGKYSRPTYKISCDSDEYRGDNYNYGGAIIYLLDNKADWINEYGNACGRRGKSFYVIIKITDSPYWNESLGQRGNGIVHTSLVRKALGYNIDNDNTVCGGGFGWSEDRREVRFNSYPMNGNNINWGFCRNDNDNTMSEYERLIVDDCWREYKACNGDFSKTYDIPYKVNYDLDENY